MKFSSTKSSSSGSCKSSKLVSITLSMMILMASGSPARDSKMRYEIAQFSEEHQGDPSCDVNSVCNVDEDCGCGLLYMNPPARKGEAYKPTYYEQLANVVTHGVWIVPSTFAAHKMYQSSISLLYEVVALVYGAALFSLFTVSTAFHLVSLHKDLQTLKVIFQKFDRIIIYVFITACYMPWLLLQDNGGFGDEVAFVLCSGAVAGIIFSYFFHETYKTLDTIAYLLIGVLPAIPLAYLSERALAEVAVGGVIYVAGVAFFRSDGRIPFAHAIWHLFVAGGAIIHFYAIWTHLYSIPA